MNSKSPKEAPPYNPAIFGWARQWRGRTPDQAAKKVGKTAEVILGWENDIGAPTVRQARILAEFYGRHFLEFFLKSPPDIPTPSLISDFRMHAGIPAPTETWEVRNLQQWAETQRISALDLFDELRDAPPEIPAELFANIATDPEVAASMARNAIGFSIQDQFGLPQSQADTLPNLLRKRFEEMGILTLKNSHLKHFGMRGICIAAFPLPVIVISDEAPSAQAFTLAHELAHVLIKESGITGFRTSTYFNQPLEKWCDGFAASFLMPKEYVTKTLGQKPSRPAEQIEDLELERLASIFRVSPHAMLIRLVHLRYVQDSYYWNTKKPEFDAEEMSHRKFGRAKYYGVRYRTSLGDLYTGLVIDAWSSGRITNHNAAEYMGIKNLAHLNAIKEAFLTR